MNSARVRRPRRRLAFVLVLVLLCAQGLGFHHLHDDGDHRRIPPGYLWSGPDFTDDEPQGHVLAHEDPAARCPHCSLLSQVSRIPESATAHPTAPAPQPGALPKPAAAPPRAAVRLPSAGRAPPRSC